MKTMIRLLVLLLAATPAPAQDMKVVPAAVFKPFFKGDSTATAVKAFTMDTKAVTNAAFLKFVSNNPQWSAQNIQRIFAEAEYLSHWTSAFTEGLDHQLANQPVVNVSWFAARAYCQSQGKRLPSMAEWETAALSAPVDSRYQNTNDIILDWYSRKMPEGATVGSVYRNQDGIYDLFGLVWEWTEDFDRVNFSDDSRNSAELPAGLFCGSASIDAADAADYATFVRYAFRASLKGNYTGRKLGFRCVKSL
ncbi:MAG TPA: formylglycine-generating enzyme family protein [Bacteroidales bacterium]|nr:formylglycine-generating enzyme family protein [Bacteroidales bacterium]